MARGKVDDGDGVVGVVAASERGDESTRSPYSADVRQRPGSHRTGGAAEPHPCAAFSKEHQGDIAWVKRAIRTMMAECCCH